jgi:hypothetical protein
MLDNKSWHGNLLYDVERSSLVLVAAKIDREKSCNVVMEI